MTYYIVVENGQHGQYTAQILGWPDTMVKGASRQEVLLSVRQHLASRLAQAEIIPLEMEPSPPIQHPWMKFAGMFEDDPMFDQVLEDIQIYRQELDTDDSTI
ncbi:MAG: hypothetical protein ETSY1_19695 [Candidatus Entotheonella factor]|uniref:Uncharacterized protein n=1 Tax=Entotheonella factor TaxID=1429438 RepID=W4LLI6_ENTF1|nr:MAG: hypothetical protein ETSY1_19695 [Candidatus Entotheonella factor]